MLQRRQNRVPLAAIAGLCTLLIGATVLATKPGNQLGQSTQSQSQEQLRLRNPKSAVLPLVSLSPAQRTVQLQAIAQLPKSQDRNRARYLLASDLIQLHQGSKALSWLKGLDQDYPALAATWNAARVLPPYLVRVGGMGNRPQQKSSRKRFLTFAA